MFKFNEVEPFLIVAVAQMLRENTELFSTCRSQAIEIIKRYVTIDESVSFPQKLLLPAAWIISYIYVNTSSSIEKDEQARYLNLYNEAINIIEKDKFMSKATSQLGTIDGVWL